MVVVVVDVVVVRVVVVVGVVVGHWVGGAVVVDKHEVASSCLSIQTLSLGPLLTFRKLVQELTRT